MVLDQRFSQNGFFLIKTFLKNRAILKFGGWHDLRLKVFQNEWAE
jgi:hypothetical protein